MVPKFGGLEKKPLLSFTPKHILDERSRHRTMAPEEEYQNGPSWYPNLVQGDRTQGLTSTSVLNMVNSMALAHTGNFG